MYYYFNDNQVTFRHIDLKPFYGNKESLKSLNDCSNFRPKSIGKRFYELTTKQRTRRTNIILIPDEQNYYKVKSTQNPIAPKT